MHEVLRQDPSVEVGPTGLGTVLSTLMHYQKAKGMVSLCWNLQWLSFALQMKNKLLSRMHRPGSSPLAPTLLRHPGLCIAPWALSPWPSQLPLPV